VEAKALAQSHAQRGQERFCQLCLWAKNVEIVDPEAVLMALTVSAGQFVESHLAHARTVLGAAKELGISAQSWVLNPIQRVLHQRKLAQMPKSLQSSRGDPRVKWSGERYQSYLDISDEDAHRFGLTEIVGAKLARAVKRARKTKEQWRAQTKKATQARSDKADRQAIIAQNMHMNGCGIKIIANQLKCTTRTVYLYLKRLVKLRLLKRITTELNDTSGAVDACLPTAGTNFDKRKALSSKFPPKLIRGFEYGYGLRIVYERSNGISR